MKELDQCRIARPGPDLGNLGCDQFGFGKLIYGVSAWIVINFLLIALLYVYWNGANFSSSGDGRLLVFLHVIVIGAFYKVNEKYFKYVRCLKNRIFNIKNKDKSL